MLRRARHRTAGEPAPRFDGLSDRVRVVVEDPDGASRGAIVRLLQGTGYEVVGCGGPGERGPSGCPVTTDAWCPAVADAAVVVSTLRLHDPVERAVLTAIRARYPTTPLVLQATSGNVEDHPELAEGCEVVAQFTSSALPAAVERALRATAAGGPA